jgi:hypothetical protein
LEFGVHSASGGQLSSYFNRVATSGGILFYSLWDWLLLS